MGLLRHQETINLVKGSGSFSIPVVGYLRQVYVTESAGVSDNAILQVTDQDSVTVVRVQDSDHGIAGAYSPYLFACDPQDGVAKMPFHVPMPIVGSLTVSVASGGSGTTDWVKVRVIWEG